MKRNRLRTANFYHSRIAASTCFDAAIEDKGRMTMRPAAARILAA